MRRLGALAAFAALSIGGAMGAGAAEAAPVKALTSSDAAAYAAAFAAAGKGDFDTADQAVADVGDRSLLGYLRFQKLTWPAARASYRELTGWLKTYADLPVADRILELAKKEKPRGARAPRLPASVEGVRVVPPSADKAQAARSAFYGGDAERAYELATQSGERWIAGLAAFRLGRYSDAMTRFQAVALDSGQNEWLRAGAAYWAARSAIAAGSPETAPDFLRIAARSPSTFYGMIAERQLGIEAGADPDAYVLAQAGFAPAPPSPTDGEVIKASYDDQDSPQLARLVRSDMRARRAVALMQIGRRTEAGMELRAGMAAAETDLQRRLWTTLAVDLSGQAGAARRTRRFDPDDYPTPKLAPVGGFTLDKALVYAVVRQESQFDPQAVSPVGAIGLMQLMPMSAAQAAGDDKLMADPRPLYDPATNLRVGQDYLDFLLTRASHGDLLRAIAAYNGGPGTLMRTQAIVGDGDPLMLIECMPAAETRDYVEKVMASYWIYRRVFGERAGTLDAVAQGAPIIDARLDR